MSRPVIKINNKELGITNSICYVLEMIISAETNDENITVQHPSLSDKYLCFSDSDASPSQCHVLDGKVAYKPGVKYYLYRPITDSDKETKNHGVNIYNEKGKLFYSSKNLPLRIWGIKEFIINPADPGYVNQEYYIGAGKMFLCMIFNVIDYDFFKAYTFPFIKDDYLKMGYSFAAGGGTQVRYFDNKVVVAYAPDKYPRWKK